MKYFDVHALKEDTRIEIIVKTMLLGKRVGFVVEKDGAKGDRYLAKIRAKIPSFEIFRGDGPVAGTELIRVQLTQTQTQN